MTAKVLTHKTIDEIEAMPIVGGMLDRGPLIEDCRDFIRAGDTEMYEKVRALKKLNVTLGSTMPGFPTYQDVEDFLEVDAIMCMEDDEDADDDD